MPQAEESSHQNIAAISNIRFYFCYVTIIFTAFTALGGCVCLSLLVLHRAWEPNFLVLLVSGSLLLLSGVILPLALCATHYTRLATHRQYQQAAVFLRETIRREKCQGRLLAQISREQFRLLVSIAVQVPHTERETRILGELRAIENNYRALVLHDTSTTLPVHDTPLSGRTTMLSGHTTALPGCTTKLCGNTTELPMDTRTLSGDTTS